MARPAARARGRLHRRHDRSLRDLEHAPAVRSARSAPDAIQSIPMRERLIFALDVADAAQARALVGRLGDAVQFYKLGLELFMAGGYFELLEWMAARGKQDLRRPEVLRHPGDRRRGGAPAAQPRRHLHDRARQPGHHGGGRRGQGRRQGAGGDGADQPGPRRPGRSGLSVRRRSSWCCRARGARCRRAAMAWCPRRWRSRAARQHRCAAAGGHARACDRSTTGPSTIRSAWCPCAQAFAERRRLHRGRPSDPRCGRSAGRGRGDPGADRRGAGGVIAARADHAALGVGMDASSSRSARRRILPTLVLGSSVAKVDRLRPLVAGQVLMAVVLAQLCSVSAGSLRTMNSATTSPECSSRLRDRRHLEHARTARHHVLDLVGIHLEARDDDHVLLAILDEHEAALIDAADVAGTQPAVRAA